MIPSDAALCAIAARAYTAMPSWQAGDVRATRTEVGELVVIAFRGTDPACVGDWMRDLDLWPMRHPHLGWCHGGFLSGALAVWPAIRADLAGQPAIITGHSLGGALALLLAALMVADGQPPPVRVVTFGAPRVGLWRLRRVLRPVRIRQYADLGDDVATVPWPYLHPRRPISLGPLLRDPLAAHALDLYLTRIPEGIDP